MGNQCGNPPLPDTSNQCSGATGELYTLPHFCTLEGVAGDAYRKDWCSKLGVEGEWVVGSTTGASSCNYNDCSPYQAVPSGCCQGCCGITGTGVRCKRQTFLGDPVSCCFNDYSCSNNKPLCFSDPQQKRTCAPNLRDMTSTPCRVAVAGYCSGADLPAGDSSWINRWQDPSTGLPVSKENNGCLYAVQRNLFSNIAGRPPCQVAPPLEQRCVAVDPTVYPLNADGLRWASDLMTSVFARYTADGFRVGALPGSPGYNPFQDFLYANVCCPYPALCQSSLNAICSLYSAQRLSLQPEVARWCGCHLPDSEYRTYTDRYQINPPCTPMCNQQGVIPRTAGNGAPLSCTQDICLIDDLTINLVRSQVEGGITVTQLCGNCGVGQSQCSCLIQNNTISAVNSEVGQVLVSQTCGSATCTRTNPDPQGEPKTITVPCDADPNYDPFSQYEKERAAQEEQARRNRNSIVILVLAVGLALIFLGILYLHPTLTTRRTKERA